MTMGLTLLNSRECPSRQVRMCPQRIPCNLLQVTTVGSKKNSRGPPEGYPLPLWVPLAPNCPPKIPPPTTSGLLLALGKGLPKRRIYKVSLPEARGGAEETLKKSLEKSFRSVGTSEGLPGGLPGVAPGGNSGGTSAGTSRGTLGEATQPSYDPSAP